MQVLTLFTLALRIIIAEPEEGALLSWPSTLYKKRIGTYIPTYVPNGNERGEMGAHSIEQDLGTRLAVRMDTLQKLTVRLEIFPLYA